MATTRERLNAIEKESLKTGDLPQDSGRTCVRLRKDAQAKHHGFGSSGLQIKSALPERAEGSLDDCGPQIFRIAPNQALGALALNMLSKRVQRTS